MVLFFFGGGGLVLCFLLLKLTHTAVTLAKGR